MNLYESMVEAERLAKGVAACAVQLGHDDVRAIECYVRDADQYARYLRIKASLSVNLATGIQPQSMALARIFWNAVYNESMKLLLRAAMTKIMGPDYEHMV